MARWALLLLAVFAAGFLLGRLTADDGGDVARAPPAQRHARTSQSLPQDADEAPAATPAEMATMPGEAPETSAEVVAPGPEDPMADTDTGILAVDFTGTAAERTAWVGYVDMRGGYESWDDSADQDSDTVRFELTAGAYDVWWLGAEDGRRRGARARVDAGHRTTVRVAEHRKAPPVPEGLGVLDLHVAASWGGGMSVDVAVSGHLEDTEVPTNLQGWASTALAPGRYTIRVGDNESEAIVEEGRVTLHRVQHRNEGDLILEIPDHSSDFCVVPAGATTPSGSHRDQYLGLTERLLAYLAEGEYDVYCQDHVAHVNMDLGVHLGRAILRAGQTTRFRCELPRGGLGLRVRVPDAQYITVNVGPIGSPGFRWRAASDRNSLELQETILLAPGRYRVTAHASRCESQSREVDVGDSVVPVTFDLEAVVLGR